VKASERLPALDEAHRLTEARDRLIVALDFPSFATCFSFLNLLETSLPPSYRPRWVKVGLELFLAEGKPLVAALTERGYQVFLDLKLHDIPNTVAGALGSILPLAPSLVTLHASGGAAMLAAAAAAADGSATQLLAVTVLTSMDAAQLAATGVAQVPEVQVQQLARLAYENGIPGVVCSAHEIGALRTAFPALKLVVPGIRPAGSPTGDQHRVATPSAAVRAGAGRLVIGRPITGASQPDVAFRCILDEIAAALKP
jgi:orotidine-5'-phosphate decarboxylase